MGLMGSAVAQVPDGFNMPFSQFGLGSSELPYNMPIMTRLGGVAYTRAGNNFVNPFNPASYASIEQESFVFDMGVNLQLSTLRGANQSTKDADGNIGYLLAAMPVAKWWKLALGLMPYSTVDYDVEALQTGADYGEMKTIYYGVGGVNEVLLGSAFNILKGGEKTPSLQAGFNVNFLTGNIDRAISYSFHGADTTFFVPSRRFKETSLNNFTYDLGLQLRQPLGTKYTLGLGVVYKPRLDLKVKETALIYTYLSSSDESLVDTIFPLRGDDAEFKSSFVQGQTVGVGLSLERNKRWQLAVDATFAEWQGMKYTEGKEPSVFGTSNITYGPYSRYAVGFEKMGNMDAATYWGRISWSLGAHLEQGALRLTLDGTEHRLDQWGVGAGLTLPMRKGRSLLTLSAGYSSLGSTDVLQIDMLTFGIAVSSCERWFFKRKYN